MQIVAAESTQARICRPALHLTNFARKGGADACLACARRCHLCLMLFRGVRLDDAGVWALAAVFTGEGP